MLTYISPSNEYPRHYGDIQLENPGWQLGDILPEGWIEVEDIDPLEFDFETQRIIEDFPIEVDGVWKRNQRVENLTEEELQQRKVGLIRGKVANGEFITAEEAQLLVG